MIFYLAIDFTKRNRSFSLYKKLPYFPFFCVFRGVLNTECMIKL